MDNTQTNTTETVPELLQDLKRRLMIFGGSALVIIIASGVSAYFIFSSKVVSIDTSSVSAPLITLSPTTTGRLNAVYVNEGDMLNANAPVALVGTEVIQTKTAGIVVNLPDNIGAQINSGQAVAQIIDPTQLRVVGKIDENKGLSQISVGDPVVFTVDAFGSKKFKGVVDEIVSTSNQSDIVFSISDKRAEQSFNIKARFDIQAYPELKNGMSARMKIYQQ